MSCMTKLNSSEIMDRWLLFICFFWLWTVLGLSPCFTFLWVSWFGGRKDCSWPCRNLYKVTISENFKVLILLLMAESTPQNSKKETEKEKRVFDTAVGCKSWISCHQIITFDHPCIIAFVSFDHFDNITQTSGDAARAFITAILQIKVNLLSPQLLQISSTLWTFSS